MNQKPSVINTFDGGMVSDLDTQRSGNKTYSYSLNGRVVFNTDGTLSWETGKGNKLAIACGFDYGASSAYQFIGCAEIDSRLIVFSTLNTVSATGNNSEIGIITENQFGNYAYKTIFNDKYDPYGQLLRFNTRYQIRANAVLENADIVRTYWNDDFNEPRAFNVVTGVAFNYAPPYPGYYSVHGMSRMCDVQYGLLKYKYNISGSLTAGKREYFYRLYQASGYATPWSPGSGLVFVTADQVNTNDWNQYQMSPSGTPTKKGHLLEVKYIDTRFQKIEVACALYQLDQKPIRADIIFQGDITGSTMEISHISDTGIVPLLNPEALVQRYVDILHAKTQVVNENYYHNANVVLRGNIEIDTSGITIQPFLRRMLSDQRVAVDTTPFTNQGLTSNDSVDVQLFNGWQETYLIGSPNGLGDYINYKGTQWEHLFKGEFRGQAVPYAIVLFSRKGQAFFAQHIGDFTFPEQYNNNWQNAKLSGITAGTTGNVGDYTLTTDDAGGSTYRITNNITQGTDIVLNLLGKKISGIDLTDVLYDANGELQISGFSIVRADRIPNLVGQGLIMNLSRAIVGQTSDSHLSAGSLLHSSGNKYFKGANNTLDHGGDQTQIVYNYFSLEMPDYMINPTIMTEDNRNLQFKLIGACQAAYLATNAGNLSIPIQIAGKARPTNHYYTKNYHTFMNIHRSDQSSTTYGTDTEVAGGNFGAQYDIDKIWTNVFDYTRDNYFRADDLALFNQPIRLSDFVGSVGSGDTCHAAGHQNYPVIKSIAYNNASATTVPWGAPPENRITYYIVNVITGQSYTLTESIVSSRIYKNIGHFIPVNAQTIQAATSGGRVVFNDCEVWGGDCFNDYFGYARLLPCYENEDTNDDYAFGLIFPCETVYNHTMRKGYVYPGVSTRPESTELFLDTVYVNGLFISDTDPTYRRLEDFNVNSVLQATDKISSYNVKNTYFKDEPDSPTMEMVSLQKFAGETYDAFRYFLVDNFQYADSKLGHITSLQSLGMNLYVLQEKGFGRIRFNERTLQSTDTENLTVGSGQGYDKHEYIEWEHGCQHQFSVINNGRMFYWVDAFKGKNCRFGADGFQIMSDTYGQHDFFTAVTRDYWQINDPQGVLTDSNENIYDNPCDVGGIAAVYDFENESAYWTFTERKVRNGDIIVTVGTPDTIEYNEKTNQYKSHWSFTPKIYLNFRQNFLSPDSDNPNRVYVHNEGQRLNFYGGFYPATLKFSASPTITAEKAFDNVKVNMNPQAMGSMASVRATTENGTQLVNFNDPNDDRPIYREGYLVFPLMAINQDVRVRGKYVDLEYTFANGIGGQDNLVRITDHETFYRKSYR